MEENGKLHTLVAVCEFEVDVRSALDPVREEQFLPLLGIESSFSLA
jgi:hypothetical protein